MIKRLLLLLSVASILLSACGTLDVSIQQQNAPVMPAGNATQTTLEIEATSMSAYVTQQAATMIALTQAVPPATQDALNPWTIYQNNTFGFLLEYPMAYGMAPNAETCGLEASNEAVRIGHQIEIRFLSSNGLSLEEYANDLLQEKDWRVESTRHETVGGRQAITVDYRFGGTDRFGTITLVEYNGLVYAFQFTAGDFCTIPGYEITEPEAYAHVLQSFRILAMQLSPTPEALTEQVHPILIFPPYESPTGYLLGGSWQGQWLDSTATAGLLRGDESYALYENNVLLGFSDGSLPRQNPPFCPEIQEVSLHSDGPLHSIIALDTGWTAVPRRPEEISTSNEIYRQAMLEFLESNGLHQPDVRIDRIVRADLEGDGSDEIILSASHFDDMSGHDVAAGDYSAVLLRKVNGDSVVTYPLIFDHYLQASPSSFPQQYLLAGILDLDGDGKMEIVVNIAGWEKMGAIAYEVQDTTIKEILRAQCP
jgi:hypothetical protein